MSLRARLTIAVVGVVAAVLLALAIAMYAAVRHAAWQQHDAGLRGRAVALASNVEHDEPEYEFALPRDAGFSELWLADGSVLGRSSDGELPRVIGFADVTLPDGRTGRAFGHRFVPRGEAHVHEAGELWLVLADGVEDVDAAIASVQRWFWLLGALALAAIAGVCAWTLARGLRPLDHLARDLERIDDRSLATQVAVDGQPAELRAPVEKLNELLARLAAAFDRERQFTADVSHELRTPLAGLRTLLEVTRLAERTGDEYRAAIGEALDVVVQLAAVAENLLMLARLDAGQVKTAREPVVLKALVEDCWKPYAELAASRSLAMRNLVADDTRVETDREKLRIVVSNLLSNAAEYTERGGWIEVSSERVLLAVSDSGPQVAEIDRVFDRMWRGDAARTATGLHCGIGLALARSLCTCMELSLTASSTAERTTFAIERFGSAGPRSAAEGRRGA